MPYGTDTYGVEAFGSEGVAPAQIVTMTTGIPSDAVFGAGGSVVRSVTMAAGIASAEAFGATGAKVNFILTMPSGIASGEAFGTNGSINRNVTMLAGIPSANVFGTPFMAMFMVNMLNGIVSGEAFGNGGEVLNNYVPGWSVKVLRLSGGVVAELGRHTGLKFQKALSGKGSGTITVLLEDALEIGLLNEELVWRVFYDGIWAYSFFSEAVDEKRVSQDMARSVTFSGPGIAECLEWGTILPQGYPAWTNRNWSYTNARSLKIWRDLFAAVQGRGGLPMVVPSFSDATDSSGAAWVDSVSMEIEPGGTLYSYLDKLTSIAGVDWIMTPSFGLDVFRDYGTHNETKVRFQIASDQITFQRGRDRSGLRNVGYAEGSLGGIQEAVDAGSVSTWGRRETYIQAGDSVDSASSAAIAAQLVDQSKDERVQITFSVMPASPDRKVFYNYDVGDWVGVEADEPGIAGNYRVVAITCSIDTEGNSIVELGMQSLFEFKEARLEKLQANGGGNSSVSAGLQSGMTPGGTITAGVPAGTPTAPTGLSLSTGANENRVYIDVSWTTVTPVEPDPVVAYEVELSRVVGGVVSAQRTVTAPVRFEPVEPNVQYSVRVRAITRLGRSSAFLGPSLITAGQDATIPATVTGLLLGAAIRSITLTWNEVADIDVVNGNGTYDVQIDTVNTFGSPNLRGKRVSGTVMSFTDLPTQAPTLYYGRARAVDSSGNVGPWSSIASGTTQQAVGTDITPLSIDTALIAAAAITNAKIANLAVDSAKISDVSAGKITAGTITAATITLGSGGVFRAGRGLAPYHYVLIDENGIRFYLNGSAPYAGGTLSLEANVSTGNLAITGAITATTLATTGAGTIGGTLDVYNTLTMQSGGLFRSAPSGERVEIGFGFLSDVRFYSSSASENSPGVVDAQVSGTRGSLNLVCPNVSGSDSRGFVAMRSAPTSGGIGNVAIGAVDYTLVSGRSCDIHSYLDSAGGAYWYGAGGAQKLRIESSGTLVTQNRIYAEGDIRSLNAGMISDSYRAVWGHRNGIDAWGYSGGAVYQSDNGGDKGTYLNCYSGGWVQVTEFGNALMQWKAGGEWRLMTWDVPVLGGMDALGRVNNANMQIGRYTSSAAYKEDIAPLPMGDDNPIYDLAVKSYKYRSDQVGNAEEINRYYDEGIVGLIAEEVAEVLPQGVNWWRDDNGNRVKPTTIDDRCLVTYLIAAVQHLRQEVKELKGEK